MRPRARHRTPRTVPQQDYSRLPPQQKHWNTVLLESLPEVLIKEMIQHFYNQVLAKVPKKIANLLIH